MRILGVDFTSAPSSRKLITCAYAWFDGSTLEFEKLDCWRSFEGFEQALRTQGPWVAGMDFPFGQSRRLVENIGWPPTWEDYVLRIADMDRKEFRTVLEEYKAPRAAKDKHHKRTCDVISNSQSPQTLFGTPVGLMFFEGAPRLLAAGVHLPLHRAGDTDRTVLEAYPGVAARTLIGKRSYKNDSRSKQTADQLEARQSILAELLGGRCAEIYGFELQAPMRLAEDPGGDDLDALLCAIQAAWGWVRRHEGYGAPADVDSVEGWICDPALLT